MDATLTRDDVAKRLGVSVSTVRRLEGTRIHPLVTDNGVRRFKAADVEELAIALAAKRNSLRNAEKAYTRAAELPKGELAALVFERLEQRHSLAEIVIALRVPPEEVRELFHAWRVGLWVGELQRKEPAIPTRRSDEDVIWRATQEELSQLLAQLPDNRSTRISVARDAGEYSVPDSKDRYPVEYRNLIELGGFIVSGPVGISEIMGRYGEGEYRISAYALDVPGLRWEVFARLENPKPAA